jgi:hypothetical protein
MVVLRYLCMYVCVYVYIFIYLLDTGAPKGLVHTTGGYLTHAGVTTRNTFDVQEVSAAFLVTADCTSTASSSYTHACV